MYLKIKFNPILFLFLHIALTNSYAINISKINYVHIHRLQIVCYLDISLLYKHAVLHINNMQRIAEKLTDSSVAVGRLVCLL